MRIGGQVLIRPTNIRVPYGAMWQEIAVFPMLLWKTDPISVLRILKSGIHFLPELEEINLGRNCVFLVAFKIY